VRNRTTTPEARVVPWDGCAPYWTATQDALGIELAAMATVNGVELSGLRHRRMLEETNRSFLRWADHLESAFAAREPSQVQLACHDLKGLGWAAGDTLLSAACFQIMGQAKEGMATIDGDLVRLVIRRARSPASTTKNEAEPSARRSGHPEPRSGS
jgi:hypothetical protein